MKYTVEKYSGVLAELPYFLKWHVIKHDDGMKYHVEGFRTKAEAQDYINKLNDRR